MSRAFKVVMMREAIVDLQEIRRHIQSEAGSEIAGSYVTRIQQFCSRFDLFPERGAPRDDIRHGLRTAIFERRVTIAYRIDGPKVIILRILAPGRNVDTMILGKE
jgi:toxin ParE1/3/4